MEKPSDEVPKFSSASNHPIINDEAKISVAVIRRKRWLCCGFVATLVLIVVILIITLILTIFKVREPFFRINNATIEHLELINGTNTPKPGTNATINADVSVKNRNFVSFKHQNTTLLLYYRDVVIGEARVPPGMEKARRTRRMNVTMEIIMDRVISRTGFGSDIESGLVTFGLYTRVGGRAKILVIKKHVTVKMNCTATINVTSFAIQRQHCKQKYKW